MSTIVPPATPSQADPRFVCPNCGADALDVTTHAATALTLRSACLCALGHVWTVHWLVMN